MRVDEYVEVAVLMAENQAPLEVRFDASLGRVVVVFDEQARPILEAHRRGALSANTLRLSDALRNSKTLVLRERDRALGRPHR